jgi:hypothetical protein
MSGRRSHAWLLSSALLLAALLAGSWRAPADAQGPGAGLYLSANERFGFGVTTDVAHFELTPLHAGWYVNWGAAEKLAHPAGLEFAQIVRVGAGIRPDFDTLRRVALANPGSLWLVGNEPDCIWQDNVLPETYAQQYHDVYTALKAADPTCQVAIGGVVQATPLRLQWLDRVWSSYQTRYGQAMPVDVWNVHNFILREMRGSWGCEIPPGIDATQGMLYTIADHDNMEYFRRQIVAFRQWMAAHGQRNKPLIVSEYGILLHEGLGYDYARVRNFMLATFDFFLNATDQQLGYPADGDRLVQRWAWYSLDDPSFEQQEYITWSALYNPFPPYEIRQLGRDYGAYTAPLVIPYVDLTPASLSEQPAAGLTYGAPVSVTLTVTVENRGNMPSGAPVPVQWWAGQPGVGQLLGSANLPAVPPRFAGRQTASITTTLVITQPRLLSAVVDPAATLPDANPANNTLSVTWQRWADLHISSFLQLPRTPLLPAGGAPVTATLAASISNTGTLRLPGVPACFYGAPQGQPETPLGCVDIPALEPDEAVTLTLPWLVGDAGPHRARLVADPNNAIFETNENDNVAGLTFLVAQYRLYWPRFMRAR